MEHGDLAEFVKKRITDYDSPIICGRKIINYSNERCTKKTILLIFL